MVLFSSSDFNVSNSKQRDNLRDKLKDLGISLVAYAKQSSPSPSWDCYITRKVDKNSQWGAICPITVSGGLEDQIAQTPNIYFDIPQNGDNVWISIDIQFRQQRDFFNSRYNKSVTSLLSKIQTAQGAKIRVFEKVVLMKDKRNYKWLPNNLWDKLIMPEIDVSHCNTQYLSCINNSLHQIRPTKDIDYIYEPVLVIKYDLPPHQIVRSSNVEQLIGDKIKILAPIVEFLIT